MSKRIQFNTLMLILLLTISIIPPAVVGLVSYRIAQEQIALSMVAYHEELVENQATYLDHLYKDLIEVLETISFNSDIRTLLARAEFMGTEVDSYTEQAIEEQMRGLIGLDGIVSIQYVSRNTLEFNSAIIHEESYYSQANIEEFYTSILAGKKILTELADPPGLLPDTLSTVYPVRLSRPSGEITGVLIGNYSREEFLDHFLPLGAGQSHTVILTDDNGKIMYASDTRLIDQPIAEAWTWSGRSFSGQPILLLNQVDHLLFSASIPNLGWTVYNAVPVTGITSRYGSIHFVTIGSLLVAILAALAIGSLTILAIVKPLRTLTTALHHHQSGNSIDPKSLGNSRIIEIDNLFQWFNQFIVSTQEKQAMERALRISEERYRKIFENSPVPLWDEDFSQALEALEQLPISGNAVRPYLIANPNIVLDIASKIVIRDVNKATVDLYGAKDSKELIENVPNIFRGVSATELTNELIALANHQSEYENIVQNHTMDGRVISVKIKWQILSGHEEKMSRAIVYTEDITQKHKSERIQSAIFRISQAANTMENLHELFQSIHDTLAEFMPAKNFYIATHDPSTGLIEFPYYIDEFTKHPQPRKFGNGLTEYVIRTRQPALLNTTTAHELSESEGLSFFGRDAISWLGVPLMVKDRVIGVMAVQSYSDTHQYTEEHQEIMNFVSTQVANAVDRKRTAEQLQFASTHDIMTGLYNRAYFEEEVIRLSGGRSVPIGIIILDVDNLKIINDSKGHAVGDEYLIHAAEILKSAFRSGDMVARIGGDEFAVLLPLSNKVTTQKAVDRIEKHTVEHNQQTQAMKVSFSTGWVVVTDGKQVVEGIREADKRMYDAKAKKKISL